MGDEATTLDADDPIEDPIPDVRNDPVPLHPDDPQPKEEEE